LKSSNAVRKCRLVAVVTRLTAASNRFSGVSETNSAACARACANLTGAAAVSGVVSNSAMSSLAGRLRSACGSSISQRGHAAARDAAGSARRRSPDVAIRRPAAQTD
jgi:hypothetical protein